MILQQHQAIGTDPETSIAQESYLLEIKIGINTPTVVKQNKIIAGSLIFVDMQPVCLFHPSPIFSYSPLMLFSAAIPACTACTESCAEALAPLSTKGI